MKTLTVRQFATIKRVAQNVNPLVTRKNKVLDKMKELQQEFDALTVEINGHETGIRALTGGYNSEDIVTKVVETTDKIDAKGQPVKVTKYVMTDIITYNEANNNYELQGLPCYCGECTCASEDIPVADPTVMPTTNNEVEEMFKPSIM